MEVKVSSQTKPVRPKPSAFFSVLRHAGNSIHLRRYAKVDVKGCFSAGCAGCKALRVGLRKYMCVHKLIRCSSKDTEHVSDCHRKLWIVSVDGGRKLKTVHMPASASHHIIAKILNALFLIRSPFRPLKHQKKFAEKFSLSKCGTLPPGILLAFALGSGKTHGALHLFNQRLEPHITVVASVSLLGQWEQAIRHHAPLPTSPTETEYILLGYQKFEGEVHAHPHLLRDRVVALDEAHHYKNATTAMSAAIDALGESRCILVLTGTPVRNDVRDLDLILRLLGRPELIPATIEGEAGGGDGNWSVFADTAPPDPYADKTVRHRILHGLRGRVVQYHPRWCEKESVYHERYPQTVQSTHEHSLTWQQTLEWALYGQGVSIKINGAKVSIGATGGTLRRLSILNAITDSESDDGVVYSSKADALVDGIRAVGAYPQVAYSRFKANMLEPVAQRIRDEFGIRTELLTGDTPAEDRQQLLNDYNAGAVAVLLICRVGGEGLDLTADNRALHLLEPQNNHAEEEQVIGRVIRYSRAKRDARVEVPISIRRYCCRFPTTPPTKAERNYFKSVVNADLRLIRAFTGKYVSRADFEGDRVETPTVTSAQILKFVEESMDRDGRVTEEQRMAAANVKKLGRTDPLNTLLWLASETDMKAVPKEFQERWYKLYPEDAPQARTPQASAGCSTGPTAGSHKPRKPRKPRRAPQAPQAPQAPRPYTC